MKSTDDRDRLTFAMVEIEETLKKFDLVGVFMLQSKAEYTEGVLISASWTAFEDEDDVTKVRAEITPTQNVGTMAMFLDFDFARLKSRLFQYARIFARKNGTSPPPPQEVSNQPQPQPDAEPFKTGNL